MFDLFGFIDNLQYFNECYDGLDTEGYDAFLNCLNY